MTQRNRSGDHRRLMQGIGLAALILCAVSAIAFAVILVSTMLLPGKYIAAVLAGLVLMLALVAVLIWNPGKKGRCITGAVLSVLFSAALVTGTLYINKGLQTAKEITTPQEETAAVGIYVRADDINDFSQVAATYTYGILAQQDRENTDDAIAQLNQEYGVTIVPQEYDGLPQLIDAILGKDVDAIILNSAYLDLLSEMEGYETAADQLKEATITHVKPRVVEAQLDPNALNRLQGNTKETDNADDDAGMIFTVFISGIDSRSGLIAKSRSDVNILASVNTATHKVVLISTPRDYYVPLSISGGAKDKLTHAGIYGIDVCMDTMAMLYDVNVDYYFRVNFSGFEDIIDALGGVTVNSDYAFSTGSYSYTQGANQMDGAKALAFVRERHAFAQGDRQRGKNQMALIQAVIQKAISPELLVNYNSIMDSLAGSFETSVPYDLISTLIRQQLKTGGSWSVSTYSVDGTGDSQIPYSMSQRAYVMVPDQSTVDTAKQMIQDLYDGK
jgi:polyisoprenyl-teichoic acid--peptidoglycan teichoic acid transferase